MNDPSRVRVRREVPGGEPATCTSSRRFSAFTFDLSRAFGGRVWLAIGTDIFPGPLTAGQCAGPLIDDVTRALPSVPVRLRELARRGTRVSLSGRFQFHSGPLSGTVISTLRFKSRGAKDEGGERFFPEGRSNRHRTLFVELKYRIVRAQGEIRSDFRAIDAPICELRDACGTHGSDVYSLAQEGGSVDVFGATRAHSRHAPALRRAIRLIAHDRGLDGFGFGGRSSRLLTSVFVRPGGERCTDRLRPRHTYVVLGARKRLRVEVFGDPPSLRGRCPGPTEEQSLHGSRLASARYPLGRLARRSFELVLRADRGFKGGAFRGRQTAHVEFELRRTRATVRVVKPGRDGSIRISRLSGRSAP
jgi:hypothetical protein